MSENVEFCDSSGSEMVEEGFEEESEQQVNLRMEKEKNTGSNQANPSLNCEQQLVPEKRGRQEDEEEIFEDDDGFQTIKRVSKKPARRNSKSYEEIELRFSSNNLKPKEHIVCITAKNALPRQFGMAKLLRSHNIGNIIKLVYKNPYRALIYFDKKENAEKMLNCEKILGDLECNINIVGESPVCYGILRQVDLEIEDKEILENLTCDFGILSAKRLKRQDSDGKWVNSETIRLCFKNYKLPTYVYGFGCRFQVEPYIFPVSQCSGCWRFGHLSRTCPLKKILCPKCGKNHENCETTVFKCINCKGPHMAMYKKCPVFLKEKEIRNIMSKMNCSYTEGLERYKVKRKEYEINTVQNLDSPYINEINQQITQTHNTDTRRSYREVVATEAVIHEKTIVSEELESEDSQKLQNKTNTQSEKTKKKKTHRKKTKKRLYGQEHSQENTYSEEENTINKSDGQDEQDKRKDFFYGLYIKIKDICLSRDSFSNKLGLIIKIVVKDCITLCLKTINCSEILSQLISFSNNG